MTGYLEVVNERVNFESRTLVCEMLELLKGVTFFQRRGEFEMMQNYQQRIHDWIES